MNQLSASGQLDNTYVLYTSDNGLHLGQFSLGDGKATAVEEDSRVPFYIRGPGIPAGQVIPTQTNLIDMAPTLLSLAGECSCTRGVGNGCKPVLGRARKGKGTHSGLWVGAVGA